MSAKSNYDDDPTDPFSTKGPEEKVMMIHHACQESELSTIHTTSYNNKLHLHKKSLTCLVSCAHAVPNAMFKHVRRSAGGPDHLENVFDAVNFRTKVAMDRGEPVQHAEAVPRKKSGLVSKFSKMFGRADDQGEDHQSAHSGQGERQKCTARVALQGIMTHGNTSHVANNTLTAGRLRA